MHCSIQISLFQIIFHPHSVSSFFCCFFVVRHVGKTRLDKVERVESCRVEPSGIWAYANGDEVCDRLVEKLMPFTPFDLDCYAKERIQLIS